MGFVSDKAVSNLSRRANDYARKFDTMAKAHGVDLSIEVIIVLVDLFGEALRDPVGAPTSADVKPLLRRAKKFYGQDDEAAYVIRELVAELSLRLRLESGEGA